MNENSFLFNSLLFEYEKDGKIVCSKMSSLLCGWWLTPGEMAGEVPLLLLVKKVGNAGLGESD